MSAGMIVSAVFGLFFLWAGIRLVTKKDTTYEKIRQWQQYPTTTARITGTYRSYDYKHNCHSSYYHYRADIRVNGIWCKADGVDSFQAARTCADGEEVAVAYRPIQPSRLPRGMKSMARKMLEMVVTMMTGFLGMPKRVKDELLQFDDDPKYQFKILDAGKFRSEQSANSKPDGGGIFFICFGGLILLIGILAAMGIIES